MHQLRNAQLFLHVSTRQQRDDRCAPVQVEEGSDPTIYWVFAGIKYTSFATVEINGYGIAGRWVSFAWLADWRGMRFWVGRWMTELLVLQAV